MKFKNGDSVKIINRHSNFYGATGTVVGAYCGTNYEIVSVSIYIAPGIKHDVTFGASDLTRSNVVYEPKLKGETENYGDTMFKIPLNSLYGMMDKNYRRGDFTQMFNKDNIPEIRNVYFNDPLTCVIWKDGTKTFVKNADGDHNYDPEKALAMAISKKALGNKYNYYKEFEKWLPEDDEKFSVKSLLEASGELRKSFSSFKIISKEYMNKRMALTKNPVEKAYLALLKVNDDPTSKDADFAAVIEEAIGYLGEALDN